MSLKREPRLGRHYRKRRYPLFGVWLGPWSWSHMQVFRGVQRFKMKPYQVPK